MPGYNGRITLSSLTLESNGVKVTQLAAKLRKAAAISPYQYDLATLPGTTTYDLAVVAKETFGPTTKLDLFHFVSDRTAPPTRNDLQRRRCSYWRRNHPRIFGFQISDTVDPNPQIIRMTLVGGPSTMRSTWATPSSKTVGSQKCRACSQRSNR